MENVLVLINKLLSLVMISLISFSACKVLILKPQYKEAIAALLNRVTLPLIIIVSYLKVSLSLSLIINALYIIGAYIIISLITYFSTKLIMKSDALNDKQASVLLTGAMHSNVAFLGFPLLISIFGEMGLVYGSIYFMADNFALFTMGIKRLTKDHPVKQKIHPVSIALFIAIVLMVMSNVLNLDLTNNFVYEGVNAVGSLTTPLSFIFIGMIIFESKPKELLKYTPAIKILLNKMIIIPLIMIALFKLGNPPIETIVISVILIQALMPPYSSLLAMSYEYNQDIKAASSMVIIGHIMAAFTIPIMYLVIAQIFQ